MIDLQVTCQLAKEIQLKHRAPVIGITILDGASVPLPDPLEVSQIKVKSHGIILIQTQGICYILYYKVMFR